RKCRGSAEFPEQLDQRRALGPGEPSRHKIHRRFVTGEYFRRLLLSSRREPDDAGPAIALVRFARHKAARLESVHGCGYRSAGELDPSANLVDGLWSLVEQHLHDCEVREADLGRLDAARRQALKRPMRLHHHEPQMRARNVGGLPSCRGVLHSAYILTSRYLMSSDMLS